MKLPREDQQTKNEKIDKWIFRGLSMAVLAMLLLIAAILLFRK
jgi:hypothetical protein